MDNDCGRGGSPVQANNPRQKSPLRAKMSSQTGETRPYVIRPHVIRPYVTRSIMTRPNVIYPDQPDPK